MTIGKREYIAIRSVLLNRADKIKLNKTWSDIHNESGIGNESESTLYLSSADLSNLRNLCIVETGSDPLLNEISGTRTEVAGLVKNEKWATKSVFDHFVRITSIYGTPVINNEPARIPKGTLLNLNYETIDASSLSTVIIIENGEAIINWHQYQLPDELKQGLAIYRGHDAEARYVKEFIASLPAHIKTIGFYDFDPAGIGMAYDNSVDAILIPAKLDSALLQHRKIDAFQDQIQKRPDLSNQLPENWQSIWEWMVDKKHQCALTQEHILINKIELVLLHR